MDGRQRAAGALRAGKAGIAIRQFLDMDDAYANQRAHAHTTNGRACPTIPIRPRTAPDHPYAPRTEKKS